MAKNDDYDNNGWMLTMEKYEIIKWNQMQFHLSIFAQFYLMHLS